MKEPAHIVLLTMMTILSDSLSLNGEKENSSSLHNYHSFCALAGVLCSMIIPEDKIDEVVSNLKKIRLNYWISQGRINRIIKAVKQ